MSVIDAHVHLYPPEIGREPEAWAAAQREPHWAELCTRRRADGRPVQTFPRLDDLLCDMDAAGVDRAVLLGWYWERPETCAIQNRFYAQCVRAHPDRLAAFASIHPSGDEAAACSEIRRAHNEGVIGVGELSPHAQRFPMDDRVFEAVLALAAELKLPVNLHAADPGGRKYPGRIETPLDDFLQLARAHPRATFILAHWGGGLPFWETTPAIRRDLGKVYYDTSASPLIYDNRIWRAVFDVVQPEKVLLGTDYPLILHPKAETKPGWGGILAEVAAAELTEAERSALLAGNATRLFGLK